MTNHAGTSESFNLDPLPPSDRIAYWNEVVCANFAPADNSLDIPADRFTARVLRRSLASTSIYRVQAGPVLSVRDSTMIRRKPLDDFFLSLITEGVVAVSQNGRQATQQAGELLLYSGDKPLKHEIRERCNGVWIRLPRRLLDSRLSNAESFTARTISSSTPIGAMTSSFLLNAASVDLKGEPSVASHILNSMVELIAAALTSSHSALGSSHHVNLLDRVKEYIGARLSDPDFSCDDVIQVIGVSRSTLNRLFAFEGTTPSRWLWHKRLEHSRTMLEARGTGRIIDVAANCGFKDAAHFSRVFKAEFGMSPSAVTGR